VSEVRVPLSVPEIGEEEIRAVTEVLRRRWLTMGQETEAFEGEIAALVGVEHAIAVSSCTAGLHLAMLALEIGPGDEVIVPSLSFVATANAVRYVGATPIFAECDSADDLNASPATIEPLVGARTRAVVAVHYAGQPADLTGLRRLAEARGIALVEDAAQSIGASRDGITCGAGGALGCFSFYSTKNVTTGEGGVVTTGSAELARRLRLLRSHGMTASVADRDSGRQFGYDVVALGYNFRIDELRAAMGRVQLRRLPDAARRRRALTERYWAALDRLEGVGLPFREAPGTSSHHLMPILLPDGSDREAIARELRERGIQTSVHYRPIHQLELYRGGGAPSLPRTEAIAARELTLPLFATMTDRQVDLVVAELARVIGR
jgi:dTDP-4-amino-4,6-dideoxygalactose transaminase